MREDMKPVISGPEDRQPAADRLRACRASWQRHGYLHPDNPYYETHTINGVVTGIHSRRADEFVLADAYIDEHTPEAEAEAAAKAAAQQQEIARLQRNVDALTNVISNAIVTLTMRQQGDQVIVNFERVLREVAAKC